MRRSLPLALLLLPALALVLAPGLFPGCAGTDDAPPALRFGVYAPDGNGLDNVALLVESLRAFGGAHRDAPFLVYVPAEGLAGDAPARARLDSLGAEIRTSEAPGGSAWFPFSGKVFAAARAEAEAEADGVPVLAWLDEDTVVLQEPGEFVLPAGTAFAYRPVMHRNVGLLAAEPLDAFWTRILELLAVPESALFPMVTPADGDTIRPYFNAGCLIVRPERGLLRRWRDDFVTLAGDSVLVDMCRAEPLKRVFLHQTALTGAVLNGLRRDEMRELSDRINYPIFFQRMFGAKREFNDLTGVVTFRHESYFRNAEPGWGRRLAGPPDRIAWLEVRLGPRGE